MSVFRRLAAGILGAVAQHCSADSRRWAEAMLRELDFIEGDWAALFWALGSTTAILKHASRATVMGFVESVQRVGDLMNKVWKNIAGVLAGIVSAIVLVVIAFGLLVLSFQLLPSLGLEHVEWTHVLTVIVIPEAIFILAVVKLWRRRRPMAVGILLTALVLATHVVVHVMGNFH